VAKKERLDDRFNERGDSIFVLKRGLVSGRFRYNTNAGLLRRGQMTFQAPDNYQGLVGELSS
jgi:hypothetical protein